MKVYMEVTKDKYELPVVIADSCVELEEITGTSFATIIGTMTRAQKYGTRSKFVEVDIPDDDVLEGEVNEQR